MFTHVMVGTNDIAKAKAFYDATFVALGGTPGAEFNGRAFYSFNGANFGVGAPADGGAATFANGGTIGFGAAGKEQVDAWHAAALANGGTCAGEPGPRPNAPGNAYGAYARDPDGNKICAFCQLG